MARAEREPTMGAWGSSLYGTKAEFVVGVCKLCRKALF